MKYRPTTTDRSDFTLSLLLSRRRISVFGHVARLDDDTPANMALQLHINVSFNRPPDRTWRRPPGRPWNMLLDQLRNDSTRPTGDVLSTVDMVVQRRDGPRRLRDHDDDVVAECRCVRRRRLVKS